MRFWNNRPQNRFLIVGLGNPGKKYKYTRHNVGFDAVDHLAKEYGIKVSRSRFSSLIGEGFIGVAKIILMKPMTYMNLSGQAVAAALRYYSLPIERILVICDDVNLTPGVIRIRAQGSSGGQKGLLNIEDMLETNQYMRIRFGIGQPTSGPLPDYVLSMPTVGERSLIQGRFDDLTDAVRLIIQGDLQGAQSRFN
ncbi:MAG: aminoacyl-tRNA hydrolase [Oscillospiraceae bacterium]|nr:aminoacyl-tRNA hydrolase [Oscillospiraceae bacterium]